MSSLLFEEDGRSCKFCPPGLLNPEILRVLDSGRELKGSYSKGELTRRIDASLSAMLAPYEGNKEQYDDMKAALDKTRDEWHAFLDNVQSRIFIKRMHELSDLDKFKEYIALMHIAAQNGYMKTVELLHRVAAEDGGATLKEPKISTINQTL